MDITGIGSIADFLNGIVTRVWPDKNKQMEVQADIQKALLAGELADHQAAWDNAKAQIQVNDDEAKSQNLFVSSWRPACGWVCASALAWTFVLQPFAVFFLAAFHAPIDPKTLPVLDTNQLMPILLGMLGLGTMRSVEKVKGVSNGH